MKSFWTITVLLSCPVSHLLLTAKRNLALHLSITKIPSSIRISFPSFSSPDMKMLQVHQQKQKQLKKNPTKIMFITKPSKFGIKNKAHCTYQILNNWKCLQSNLTAYIFMCPVGNCWHFSKAFWHFNSRHLFISICMF